ncbi:SAM-dependent methyltransferase [Altererythrobacter sp. CC-YST694]|uniref:class I SAM-dependent methyltransferase n=1 Tax=Altererythrobacter sp. CC-YST694 TaxID=2755038 RepID=UPI001D02A137|nr:SAM-dependent methyltransferase [Altererythrobacter sp. CC-YST694]MCB5425511.1 SAM-dependent methyltransferase [Altererythrobacter sp. CC-YST694]
MSGQPEGSLAASFRRLIAATGPISLAHYMAEANARYYGSRDPFGTGGDFVTAPEISQMFGELVGLWLADMWHRAGQPVPVHYVELGPGRGTLARDALRAMARAGLAPQVHLVEGSPSLREIQREAVPQAQWHHDLSTLPSDGPILLAANEFLDALPVRQLVKTPGGWRERMVAVDESGAFVCLAGTSPMDSALPEELRDAAQGTLVETCPAAAAVVQEVAGRLAAQGGAALFIDYGHAAPRTGSTLQAVRAHQKVDPFADPGEADLTAHVDFATLAPVAQAHGAQWLGTTGQGPWLTALGMDARAAALTRAAPHLAGEIEAARHRLVAEEEMGDLFKVMGLAASGWPQGAGF